MIARLGLRIDCRDLLVEQRVQLTAQAPPVGTELIDRECLLLTRTQPEMHVPGRRARQRGDGLGIKTKLQHVTGFSFNPR